MRTLEQYLPAMREAQGRWYWPRTSTVAPMVAIALLLVAFVYAYRYPTMKAEEAALRLERFNVLTLDSAQKTQAALTRLQALVAEQPEWLREVVTEQVGTLNAHLVLIQPLTREQVLHQAQAQQEAYEKAQQLIEASPFKGLTKQQVPLSAEGKAYLDALEIERPSRFDYQRLADGVISALPTLQAGLKLQAQAEILAHELDVRLNGDKAATATQTIAPVAEALRPVAGSTQQVAKSDVPINALTSALRQAEREAERQQRQAALAAESQQRRLERAAIQAELQEQRRQQQAQRTAVQQQRDSERQARAAAEARQRAERDAERQAAAEQRQAQATIEAKKRECTASLVARAKCAAQGYNPLTGMKN